MKINLLLIIFVSTFSFAQVGIGTDNPAQSSILDIDTALKDKGVLLPRVSIADLNNQAPITGTMTESLLVYNTNDVTGKGFYFWDGLKWEPILTDSTVGTGTVDGDNYWATSGNRGTRAGTGNNQDYLGTQDNRDFIIATNATERIRVDADGLVGIGQGTSDQALHLHTSVDGQGIKIQRGTNYSALTQSSNLFRVHNSNASGATIFSFNNTDKLIMENSRMYPAVNSTDNVNSTGYDLGFFARHYRRVYTQGVHTNDNDPDGGLRINIGSGGGTTADYMFSDFAHFPFIDGVKDLGRNAQSWNNLYYRNAFRTSDARKKQNISDLQSGLAAILSLNTYQYQYINDQEERLQFGFIAQELQDQIPSIVDEGEDDQKSLAVDYEQLIPVLVKAVQEQQVQIEMMKKQIEELSN